MRMKLAAAALVGALLATGGGPVAASGLTIDVPVTLDEAKVVFNLDHPAFVGDEPVGLDFMRIMLGRFAEDGTQHRIVAIFHGAAGYMALGDATYDRVRNWQGGNPYKQQIAALVEKGVEVEICGQTMRQQGWVNADLLPGIKVNVGANFRIIELVQDGYVQIQP